MSYSPSALRYGSHKIGPYRYGDMKWDDYHLDIQYAVEEGAQNIVSATRDQAGQLESIGTTLEDLRSDLNMGFSLMIERLDEQISLTQAVIEELRGIHKTLKSPLITQADELVGLGHDNLRRGLLGKALECFLRSEQLYDVNPILHFYIGKLHLDGRDETDNLINWPEAERHMLLAAKYAKAQGEEMKNWLIVWDEAYLHAAEANYLMSSEAARLGNSSEAAASMQRAAQLAEQGARGRDRLYFAAKCRCRLGNNSAALDILRKLADSFHWYWSKAAVDPDLAPIRSEIVALSETILTEAGPHTRQAMDSFEGAKRSVKNARDVDSRFSNGYYTTEVTALETSVQGQEKVLHSRKGSMGEVVKACDALRQHGATLTSSIVDEHIGILEGRLRPFIAEVSQEETKLDQVRREYSFGTFFASVVVWTLLGTPVACLVVHKASEGFTQGASEGFPYAVAIAVIINLIVVWPGRQIQQQLRLRAASQRAQGPRERLNGEIYKIRDLKAKLLS
ncbi:MAG: hypothetical protein ABSF45_13505 [Terriglobia bacterium]